MSQLLQNRYDILCLFDARDANPNGNPDAGNMPRVDPQTLHGLVSDVALKRKVREWVQAKFGNQAPNAIFIQRAANLNQFIQQAHDTAGTKVAKDKKPNLAQVEKATAWMCENFFDVRTFGAVMQTGPNAGQVQGPVQFTFARSIDPVLPMDLAITRMAVAEDAPKGDYTKWAEDKPEDGRRTMGGKQMIPYGLYACQVLISANQAQKVGFTEGDLATLRESLVNLFELNRTASKGFMAPRGIYAFKHVGTDTNADQRASQARLGCAPAHKLVELGSVVSVKRKADVAFPRTFTDYDVTVDRSGIPAGVEMEDWLNG
jgi:CRISPR-associated protein Csd2